MLHLLTRNTSKVLLAMDTAALMDSTPNRVLNLRLNTNNSSNSSRWEANMDTTAATITSNDSHTTSRAILLNRTILKR